MITAEKTKGLWVGLGSYFLWGFFPIYWKLLQDRAAFEILANRFVWSFFFYLAIWLCTHRHSFKVIFSLQKRDYILGLASALLLAINWGVYVYAVNSGQILEGSLAYFINPLLNVLVGVLFFNESFSKPLKWAVFLAAIGVGCKIYFHPHFPYVAIILAITFCAYGIVKKLSTVPAGMSSVLEGGFGLLPAGLFLAVTSSTTIQTATATHWILFVASGFVTGLPLFLFSYATQRVPYSVMGMMQFIAPTLQLLVGVFLFHEKIGISHITSFILIWLGVAIFIFSQIRKLNLQLMSS
jgi:chloramphenicol-sensitive protein RarD